MLYVFEGARNSGKTHLSSIVSSEIGKSFKYDFVGWFRFLGLDSKESSTHLFALGKESMILQLNRDGVLTEDLVLDRGIFTVMSWGVLEGRISIGEAKIQVEHLISEGLLAGCKFFHIKGNNPNDRGIKDEWDSEESRKELEIFLIDVLMEHAREFSDGDVDIVEFWNDFDHSSENRLYRMV